MTERKVADTATRSGKLRWTVFLVSSGALALMTAVLMLPNLIPPLVTDVGGAHFVHDVSFLLLAGMLLTGLAAQLGAPRRRVGAMLVTLAFPAVFMLVALPAGFVFPPLIVMLALGLIAAASHPAARQLRPTSRPHVPTLVLALLWAVPGVVYAIAQIGIQRAAPVGDPHAEHGHWVGMAAFAVIVALLTVVAGLRVRGWRVVAGTAVVAAAVVGAVSIAYPALPSSFDTGWGFAAIAWALTLVAASVTVRRQEHQIVASHDGASR